MQYYQPLEYTVLPLFDTSSLLQIPSEVKCCSEHNLDSYSSHTDSGARLVLSLPPFRRLCSLGPRWPYSLIPYPPPLPHPPVWDTVTGLWNGYLIQTGSLRVLPWGFTNQSPGKYALLALSLPVAREQDTREVEERSNIDSLGQVTSMALPLHFLA